LILRLAEGMTGPEIAARTGLTPGSVRVNLHRGMQQLREKLAQASQAGTMQRDSRNPGISNFQGKPAPRKRN
jgi:DNA-binding NarL/FixJ family response regulator